MTELNPNHPVTRKVADHWHKIVALHVRLVTETEGEELARGAGGLPS